MALTIEEQAELAELDRLAGQQTQLRTQPIPLPSEFPISQQEIGPAPTLKRGLGEMLGLERPLVTTGVLGETARRVGGRFIEGVKAEGAPFVGETVGELIGSKFGPKGRIVGAGAGRTGGEAFKQIGQAIINSPNAPATAKEAAKRMLIAFGVGAGTEAVSEVALGSLRRLGASLGFKSTPLKPIPDYDDIARLSREAGIDLTPAQRTTSRAIDTFEEMAENAFFGRGRIRDIKEIAQPSGVRKLVDNMLDKILPRAQRVGRGELGEILNDVILGREKAFRRTGGAFYQRVDDLVGASTVDLRGLKRLGLKLQAERAKAGGLRKPIDEVIDDIIARPEFVDFKTGHNIRSEFLEAIRNIPDKKSKAIGALKQAAANVDRKMQDAARRIGPEALKAWRIANAFWKRGKEVFNSRVIRRVTKTLADETPDKIFDAIFRAKSPKQIRTVMKLADPLTQKRLRFAFVDNMIEQSSAQIPGDISDLRTLIGKFFIDRWDKFGDEALDAIFTKEQKQNIRNVARVAKITQGKSGGAGGFLIQLIQAGPIAGVAGGAVTGEPAIVKKAAKGALLLGGFTTGMSRLLASKRGSKILTDMMTLPPNSPQFANLSVRLIREMTGIRKQIESELRQDRKDRRLIRRPGRFL